MDLMEKFSHLHRQLTGLTQSLGFTELPIARRIEKLLKLCAAELGSERVSLWSLNQERSAIACQCLYILSDERYESGVVLQKAQYPDYFEALLSNRLIIANEAQTDPRTRAFTEDYLAPLNIISMLDAPVFSHAELFGVICIEHTQTSRTWDLAELSFAAAVADTITLINEQQAWLNAQEHLQFLEQTDSLTALENRRFFNQRLIQDIERSPPSSSRTLLVLGLDHFKHLNDEYGPLAADQVLQTLAERYRQIGRRHSLRVARLGGDQFAFWVRRFLPEETLHALIEEVLDATSQTIEIIEESPVQMKASVGVLVYPNQDININDPIRCAELALQRSKDTSRGHASFFLPGWMSELQSRQALEHELTEAFALEQYVPFYQPIVNAADGQVVGIEALVRWQHPERGLIPPIGFLPLLSEIGLMEKLGEYMLDHACRDMRQLRDEGMVLDWVAVNLASEQLYSPRLVETVESVIRRHQLESSTLQLEVVEELFSQDSELITNKLQAISELGVHLSIDDFGTGYSSLSRLKNLPVSKLKIDKSFIDGLPESEEDICISRSIIGLARGMEIEIVAEGVEKPEQADWLLDHGCDYIQGYYFSRPLPLNSLREYILSLAKNKAHG